MSSTLTKTKIYRPVLARILNRFVVRMDRLIALKVVVSVFIRIRQRL